jgi:hypothetical protein
MLSINTSEIIDNAVPFPQDNFLQAVRTSCHDCRERSHIQVYIMFYISFDKGERTSKICHDR